MPEHQVARHAVAHDIQAAGVGRQVAADLAAALRAQAQGKEALGGIRGLLHAREHAAGLGRHGEIIGVDAADAIQPAQRQQQLASRLIGGSTAAVAGVASLRHQADALLVAPADDARHLCDIARQGDRQRAAAVQAPQVHQVWCRIGLGGEHAVGPDQGAQFATQRLAVAHAVRRFECNVMCRELIRGEPAQCGNAFLERRVAHEQALQAAAFTAGDAECIQLRGQRCVVRYLKPLQGRDHALAAGEPGAAGIGTKFTLPRKPHDDDGREDSQHQLRHQHGDEIGRPAAVAVA